MGALGSFSYLVIHWTSWNSSLAVSGLSRFLSGWYFKAFKRKITF